MLIQPEILDRYFKGKYSRKDFLTIKSAFGDPEKEAEIKNLIEAHWFDFNTEPLSEGNIKHVLHTIHQQIRREETQTKRTRFITVFQRIAAIMIVPLLLAFFALFYFQPKTATPEMATAEIQCPLGVRTKFTLPDGTTGFLNSGSTLEYPVIFTDGRTVKLKGEAFFDVIRDAEHPFTVNTSNLSTKVLGTQFNVIAYENEGNEEIILQEGQVEVYCNTGEMLETLQPDQKMVLNTETRQYNKKQIEADQYVSWTEGKLILRNETMQQVADRLGRWYNVEIEIEDKELLNYAFRATFIDEPLEEVLKLLAMTAPIKYKEEKRQTTKDDIYKKRKIIVRLDEKRIADF